VSDASDHDCHGFLLIRNAFREAAAELLRAWTESNMPTSEVRRVTNPGFMDLGHHKNPLRARAGKTTGESASSKPPDDLLHA